ncbi:MAG TPA: VOC family protein [Planctomycetota bacterium]
MGLFTGIEHFAIASKEPAALVAWYQRVLGFRIRTTFDNGPGKPNAFLIELSEGGTMIEIIPADAGKPFVEHQNTDPGYAHVAILVSDFNAAVDWLVASGARAEGPERSAAGGTRVRFYRDPEGNLFHILLRPQPLPREVKA